MLKIENLNVYYGKVHVLRDVSLEVKKGESVALLGRNGAGKTTLLKSIIGLLKPTSGKITIEGNEVTGWPTHKIIRLGIGYVPQEYQVFPDLKVMENFRTRLIGGKVSEERLKFLFDLFPYLEDKLGRYAGTLSGGEQKMTNIARALVTDEKLLLMDEPLGGLMPAVCSKLERFVKSMTSKGASVFIVEQTIKTALECADRAYIMEKGDIVYEGDSKELSVDSETLKKYLGIVRI